MKNTGVLDRLRRITGEDKQETPNTTRSAEISELRRRIDSIMARRPQENRDPIKNALPLHEFINGEEITTPHGVFFLATEKRSAHYFHGTRSIGELLKLNMQATSLLAKSREIANNHISEALFLDTETTGLSGGTGTLAFMIGVGWFEKDAFVTQQIFIRDFSEERAALQYLTDIVQTKKFLVSFNGKAFDVNLLATRYILNKLKNPLDGLPHLDLLFPSRRLCGHRLENSRLVTLEQSLFGVYRKDDIPGMEIPERYFAWLRRRDPKLVMDIFKHNHLDILSLAALTAHLSELIGHDSTIPVSPDPRDLLAAARLLCDRDENDSAIRILHGLMSCDHAAVCFESQKMLSLILKRKGDFENASCLWEKMICEKPDDQFAAVELAKWYEHKCRNFAAAYNLISLVLEKQTSLSDDVKDSLLCRMKRLQSRLSPK